MILVFGGTTEGRKAVEVLEEAGTRYYYSTKTGEQDITLHHGERIDGALDRDAMLRFCREHDIRLLVDAAHPFASQLHATVAAVAEELCLPLIRYDRIYPPHDAQFIYCKDFDDAIRRLEEQQVHRLLALTGTNTMSKLRPFWQHHECWWRILDRESSRQVALDQQFPADHLVYYGHDDTTALLQQLHPDAILTKESGLSGGFTEKVEAAKRAGVKVFVIEHPAYPISTVSMGNVQCSMVNVQCSMVNGQCSMFNGQCSMVNVQCSMVNGPHGLRRAVEQLLPDFFPLHSGLTTGTCATAAAIAACYLKFPSLGEGQGVGLPSLGEGQRVGLPSQVPVILPNGETISVPVGYGDDYAYVIKDSGDDPDVTNGIEIRAKVVGNEQLTINNVQCSMVNGQLTIIAGEGIGHFTLPGFDYPPGEPAINKGPREMIRQNLSSLSSKTYLAPCTTLGTDGHGWTRISNLAPRKHTSYLSPLIIRLSVPYGEEIARRTFNPRLGIEGGISIIGVSGIIKPFSEEAFIDSIRKCMQVAKASGADRVVINSGAKSERFVRERYPDLPRQAFVEYGNYIGETLKIAHELQFPNVTLGVMLGKAVKLAEGQLDTHSKKGTMNREFIAQMLREASLSSLLSPLSSKITLARELWEHLSADERQAFAAVVIRHCEEHCRPLLPHGQLTILLIAEDGTIYPAQ